ncbi:hypothetical protein OG21DRAFT_759377 [Imleria badia]|nr:hypothetical protein OG21DRAFT_759377 [Imleria badia]
MVSIIPSALAVISVSFDLCLVWVILVEASNVTVLVTPDDIRTYIHHILDFDTRLPTMGNMKPILFSYHMQSSPPLRPSSPTGSRNRRPQDAHARGGARTQITSERRTTLSCRR